MHVRVAPKQEKPYPPFVEAARNQPEFTAENIQGTVVGFFTPKLFHGASAAGFHLHFISEDHQFGGHILDFGIKQGTVSWMETAELRQHFQFMMLIIGIKKLILQKLCPQLKKRNN